MRERSGWRADRRKEFEVKEGSDGRREYRQSAPHGERGHCWHEAGGELYQRHSGRPSEVVDVTCCWCGDYASLPGYSAHTMKSTITLDAKHGPHSGLPA